MVLFKFYMRYLFKAHYLYLILFFPLLLSLGLQLYGHFNQNSPSTMNARADYIYTYLDSHQSPADLYDGISKVYQAERQQVLAEKKKDALAYQKATTQLAASLSVIYDNLPEDIKDYFVPPEDLSHTSQIVDYKMTHGLNLFLPQADDFLHYLVSFMSYGLFLSVFIYLVTKLFIFNNTYQSFLGQMPFSTRDAKRSLLLCFVSAYLLYQVSFLIALLLAAFFQGAPLLQFPLAVAIQQQFVLLPFYTFWGLFLVKELLFLVPVLLLFFLFQGFIRKNILLTLFIIGSYLLYQQLPFLFNFLYSLH